MEESDKEFEWGEHSKSPVAQSTPKVTPVKPSETGAQVQEQLQQALLEVMEAQVKCQFEQKGVRRCYKCGDPGHFRRQCPKKELNVELLEELVKMLKTLLKDQPAENSWGSQ